MSAFPAADAMVAEYQHIEEQMASPEVLARPEKLRSPAADTPNWAALLAGTARGKKPKQI